MERLILSAVVVTIFALLGCPAATPSDDPADAGTGATGGLAGTGGTAGSPAPCSTPEGESLVIEDATLDDADWESSETHTGGATVSIEPTGQAESGGVANSSYRSMTHQIENPDIGEDDGCTEDACNYGIVVSHKFLANTYTPATEGAIAYIDYSESRIIAEPAFMGAAVGWKFAIWQDGVRYLHDGNVSTAFSDTSWTAENLCGLTADRFVPDGLDLVGGSEMTFGYTRSNTNTTPGGVQRNVHGIDDFRVVVVKQ